MTLLLLALSQAVVVARFPEPSRAEGLTAELLRRPAGESSAATAAALIAASGLTPWRGEDPTPVTRSGLTVLMRHASDGREVAVYYIDSADPPVVCRIRRTRGGLSAPHQRAIRWCADRLGITLPPPRPPVS